MASRFAVGTAAWSSTSSWSATNGGASGASVPTAADDVFFTASSGANTVTTSAGDVCRSIDMTGSTATLSLANSATALTIGDASGGAATFKSGKLTIGGTSTIIVFASTSNNGGTGWTVTSGGATLPSHTFNGAGGKWLYGDAITCTVATSTITLSSGTLVDSGMTVTAGSFAMSSPGILTATGPWSLNATSGNVWIVNSGTVTATAVVIALTSTSNSTRTFAGGSNTYGTLTYTVANSPGQLTISGSNTFTTINGGSGRAIVLTNATTTSVTNWNVAGTPFGYWRAPGATFNQVVTPDSVPLTITDDIDVRVRLALDNWSTSSQALVSKWHVTAGNQGWMLRTSSSSRFEFLVNNGTTTSVAHSFTNGQVNWISFRRRKSDGRVQWFTAPGALTNPQTSDWTQLGTDATNSNAFTAVSDQLAIGIRSTVDNDPATGNFYRVQVRNNVLDDGTGIVLDVDFTLDRMSAGGGTTAYRDAAWSTFVEASSNAATMSIGGALGIYGDGRTTLASSSAGSAATLNALGNPVSMPYTTVKDITATNRSINGSLAPAQYKATKNVSGNTGWSFTDQGPLHPTRLKPRPFAPGMAR